VNNEGSVVEINTMSIDVMSLDGNWDGSNEVSPGDTCQLGRINIR